MKKKLSKTEYLLMASPLVFIACLALARLGTATYRRRAPQDITLPSLPPREVMVSPDGKIVAWSAENTVAIRDAATSKVLRQIVLAAGATALGSKKWLYHTAFSSDGRKLIGGGHDILDAWNIQSGNIAMTFNCPEWQRALTELRSFTILDLAVSPDGKFIACMDDVEHLSSAQYQKENTDRIRQGYNQFVPMPRYYTLKLWDAAQGKLLQTIKLQPEMADRLRFTPDSKTLLSGAHFGMTRIWDVRRDPARLELSQSIPFVRSVSPDMNYSPDAQFSPDGKWIAVVERFGNTAANDRLSLFDVRSGKRKWTTPVIEGCPQLLFSPDSRAIAAWDHMIEPGSECVDIWDTRTGQILRTLKVKDKHRHGESLSQQLLAFSPDWHLFTGALDGTAGTESIFSWDISDVRR